MSIELHCHTLFSIDAHGTPEELVDVAAQNGVVVLSITEHDNTDSLARAVQRAKEKNIRYIRGVEVSALFEGGFYHFLAFGIDPAHQGLQNILSCHMRIYAKNFEPFMQGFIDRGYDITREELEAKLPERYPSHPKPVLAQWFAKEYMIEKGLFPDTDTANKVLQEIKKEYKASHNGVLSNEKFTELDEVLPAVHLAGGILLLAHVGLYFPGQKENQLELLEDVLDLGLDGFELYHRHNINEPHFEELVSFRKKCGCACSGGSDCHWAKKPGEFGIGAMKTPDYVIGTIDRALEKVGN